MIANYKPSEYVTVTDYEIVFDDGANNGYGFPCDENGNLDKDMNPAARENYERCLAHPEKFVRANKLIKFTRSYRDPARGTCHCGEEIWLTNDYMGACECPNCGQWYNLFGQELLPPRQWEVNFEEDY